MALLTLAEKERLKQLVDECQGGLVSDELLRLTDKLVGNDALFTLMGVAIGESAQYTQFGEQDPKLWVRGFTDKHITVFGPLGDLYRVAVPDELYRQLHISILKKEARSEPQE